MLLTQSTLYRRPECGALRPRGVAVWGPPQPAARGWGSRPAQLVAVRAGKAAAEDADDEDDEAVTPGKPLRVERLLANLGYGKRRECGVLVKKGRVTTRDGGKLKVGDKVSWSQVLLDGEELDPPPPLTLVLHKPVGYVVTSPDDENVQDPVVYDLLPYRYGRRRPFLSSVGRLDKDTSGLLLLTDDGALLHRINSPKRGIWKVYDATLADPLTAKQADAAAKKFASGTIVLENDYTPLLPAKLERTGERTARVSICEGRYHQVRRMFSAVGHKVVELRRVRVGGLDLGSLPEAEYKLLTPEELARVFEGPSSEEVMASQSAASSSGSGGGSSSVVGGSGTAAGGSTQDGPSTSGRAASAGGQRAAAGEEGLGEEDGADGGVKLTKKQRKKGLTATRRGRKAALEQEAGDDGSDEDDVMLVGSDYVFDDDEGEADGQGDGEEGEEGSPSSSGRGAGAARSTPRRRGLVVRQGAVTSEGGRVGGQKAGLQQLLQEDEEVAEALVAGGGGAAPGTATRKYRDGERWRKRREELKKMLP